MKLLDLRKLAVKQGVRVRFRLTNGMECVIDERGTAQVPELRAVPGFNLEEEFAKAAEFVLEPAAAPGKPRERARPKVLPRGELEALAGVVPAAHDEHEE